MKINDLIQINRLRTQHTERLRDIALGSLLANRRECLKLNLVEVTELTGIDPDELAEHETGELPIAAVRLPMLAAALGLDWVELLRMLPAGPAKPC